MGEYFMWEGKDALIVYDDLEQARVGLPPDLAAAAPSSGSRSVSGRRLLPALALARTRLQARPEFGGGSLTALPIIETQANDVSAYIPTNVISITDGQIYPGV